MEYRPLDVTVISADGLKDVNLISKMDVYVVVSIADDPTTKRKTQVDKDGGKSPKWNDHLKFNVDARNPNVPLVFRIRSDRPLGDKDIGVVTLPMKELLDHPTADGGGERVVEYQVRTPSGKSKGTLKFSYKFGDKVVAPAPPPPQMAPQEKSKHSDEPVTAYPAQAGASTAYAAYAPPQQGYGYPPPQQHSGYPPAAAYGYPQPPQQGYGYPPQQHGYGYPPPQQGGYGYPPQVVVQPQQVKKKKNNFGLGLGAGLLGGLLVGDMISDVGEMGAYDAGFDDAGFDF